MGGDQELTDAVIERAQESDGVKRLLCAQAFELAKEHEVEVIKIGRICNEKGIRICQCQLGCFK